ncbi:hypothetical protein [Desertivirga brevis]|uniref:hypothetical protein n=1 Tax=Desertivirga brevis TaxID=2810310 RepID=UPI001F603F47|nr:hypothetical protein [Pedobacter sp. SYSU D00873]
MENYYIKLLSFKNIAILLLAVLPLAKAKSQGVRFLVPDGVVAHYGGSIGFGSAGISYDLFKNQRGNLDFTFGYVPESKGGPLRILTGKFSYKPVKIGLKDIGTLYPVNPGTFISYTPGEQFEKWSKTQYPKGYYWWSKSTRIHLSLSTEAKFNGEKVLHKAGIKAIGVYSELNTNDLYAVSWFKNKDSMSFLEIVRVGYGVRVYF